VVQGGVQVVHLRSRCPVRGARVAGRVFAEVLHPAVVAVAHGLAQQPVPERQRARRGEVHLPDEEDRAARVLVDVRLPELVLGDHVLRDRLIPDRVVARADHRVEVGGDREPRTVEETREGAFGGGVALLRSARQVVRVRVGEGGGRVGGPQPVDARLVPALRLEPGPEVERRRGGRLAAHGRGHPAQRAGGPRPGEDAERDLRSLHLGAPGAGLVGAQPEVARGAAVQQEPVPARGEQPRHGEVGGVVARVVPRRRDEGSDEGSLVRLVRALGHVVLHGVAALVDRVGALPEAELALAPGRPEGDAGVADPAGRADHVRDHADHAGAGGHDPDVNPPQGVGRGQLGVVCAAAEVVAHHGRRVLPHAARLEPEAAGRPGAGIAALGQLRPMALHEREVPGARGDHGAEQAGADGPLCCRCRRGCQRGDCQRGRPAPYQSRFDGCSQLGGCFRSCSRGAGGRTFAGCDRGAGSSSAASAPGGPLPGRGSVSSR